MYFVDVAGTLNAIVENASAFVMPAAVFHKFVANVSDH